MKFQNPLLAVTDLKRSIRFYREVLGLRVIQDFGANVTLTGGVCLQTLDSWQEFLGAKLSACPGISYVHPPKEHRWGQRVVRLYDPDGHILEVGENMKTVCRRFLDSGMTPEQAACRMDVPLKFVRSCMR